MFICHKTPVFPWLSYSDGVSFFILFHEHLPFLQLHSYTFMSMILNPPFLGLVTAKTQQTRMK